jgi:hypothetical protein
METATNWKWALVAVFILAAFVSVARELPIGWLIFWLFLAWLVNDYRKK